MWNQGTVDGEPPATASDANPEASSNTKKEGSRGVKSEAPEPTAEDAVNLFCKAHAAYLLVGASVG